MTFKELPVGTYVLYSYQFTNSPLAYIIGEIKPSGLPISSNSVQDVFSTADCYYQTRVETMDTDKRATIIAIVSSIDDAKSRFPEYFI